MIRRVHFGLVAGYLDARHAQFSRLKSEEHKIGRLPANRSRDGGERVCKGLERRSLCFRMQARMRLMTRHLCLQNLSREYIHGVR